MGSQRESTFEKNCIKELRKWHKSWWPDKTISMAARGQLDRVGCVNGRLVALEFKRSLKDCLKGSKSSPLQEFEIGKITAAGGLGLFCYKENKEQVFETIRRFCNV